MRRIFLAMAAAFICAGSFAQEAGGSDERRIKVTVDQAVKYSEKYSKSLRSSKIDFEIQERAKKYSWNIFLPTVQATTTMNRSPNSLYGNYVSGAASAIHSMSGNPANGDPYITHGQANSMAKGMFDDNESAHWTAVVGLSASLNLTLAQIYQMKATQASYESGEITWEKAKKDNELSVRKMFYGLLLQQESLKISRESLDNAQKRYEQAAVNFRNGRIPELSMLQAQVAYENQKPTLLTAEQSFEQQLDLFVFMLGLPIGTKITLSGEIKADLKDYDADALIAGYIDNRLDVIALKQQLQTLEINKKALDMSAYTPFLSLNYSWQPTLGGYALDGSKWKDFPNKGNWNDNGSFSITLGMNLTNLLPFSANRQQANDLEDNISKLKLALKQVRDNAALEIRTSVNNLRVSKANIEASDRQIRLAQRSYDMTAVAYRNGTRELLDLRDAETQLNQAKLGRVNEEFKYISNLLDLEHSLNTTLD